MSQDRPTNLEFNKSIDGKENLFTASNASTPCSVKSDYSCSSFTSEDFKALRLSEGMDLDMEGQSVDTAAEIFEYSGIDTSSLGITTDHDEYVDVHNYKLVLLCACML